MGGFLGIAGSLVGGALQAGSASRAANQQAASAREDLEFQRETRDQIIERLDPFYQSGLGAQNALAFEMGLGNRPMIGGTAPDIRTITRTTPGTPEAMPRPDNGVPVMVWQGGQQGEAGPGTSVTRFRVGNQSFNTMEEAQAYANANRTGGTEYRGFQASPGYQFQLQQGQDSVNALAGARGGLNSGATLQALSTFNQGLANQEYGNYLSRLMGMAGSGQSAAGMQANASTNAASGVSNALGNLGNAQSAGTIGVGNAISGGINNAIGMWNYQNAMRPSGGNMFGLTPSFGGGR